MVLQRKSFPANVETWSSIDDVIIANRPLVSSSHAAFIDTLNELKSSEAETAERIDLGSSPSVQRWCGVRELVPAQSGVGHWDFFQLTDQLSLFMTKVNYSENQWVSSGGGGSFRIRLLLSGKLLGSRGEPLLQGPQAHVHVSLGDTDGYHVARKTDTELVVIRCLPEILTKRLGLSASQIPELLKVLTSHDEERSIIHRIGFGPELLQATRKILDFRYRVPIALRLSYLEAVAFEVICQVVAELSTREAIKAIDARINARDLNIVYEARDYLSRNYASPPTIPQLAKILGVNQTKLKTLFKQVLNLTIYGYILQRRMEEAVDLLVTDNFSIGEVAYMVGYEHAANFSCAFKRYYGRKPWSLKRA